jgi:predicted NACHT family NTPase
MFGMDYAGTSKVRALIAAASEGEIRCIMTQAYEIHIPRIRSWHDEKGEKQFVPEKVLLSSFKQPLVILGEPGMGKTELLKKLATNNSTPIYRAAAFLRKVNPIISGELPIIIDALDEVAAVKEGDPLHHILEKLGTCGCPRFIISCRVADWRSVTANHKITEDYGVKPIELAL